MTMTIIVAIIVVIALLILFLGNRKNSTQTEFYARRFAKLLVSHVKLYESHKLEKGLKSDNLFEFLEPEIEEARRKFKKRFPKKEFEIYFDETILKLLANINNKKPEVISNSKINDFVRN